MMQITSNLPDLERIVTDRARRQLPFATALALTQTAKDAEAAEKRSMGEVFDRPTPFTERGTYVRPATKARLVSEIGMRPVQAKYLAIQSKGGTRLPRRRAIVVPVGQRVNKYGNLPKGTIKRLAAKPDVFSGKVKGVPGLWQRPKRRGRNQSPKLLVSYQDRARYQPRFPFASTARRAGMERFAPNMARALERALRTAR